MAHYFRRSKDKYESLKGLEIFEITPVIAGGNPIDPQNKTTLTREQHMKACRYWNKIIKDSRN